MWLNSPDKWKHWAFKDFFLLTFLIFLFFLTCGVFSFVLVFLGGFFWFSGFLVWFFGFFLFFGFGGFLQGVVGGGLQGFFRYRVRKKYDSRASLLYLTTWRMVAWLL